MPALAKCRLSHASSLDEFDPESWEPEPQSDSDEDFTPSKKPAKRARSSATKRKSTCNPSGQRTTTYSSTPSARNGTSNAVLAKTDLQALSKAELVSQYLALQDQLRQAEKKAGRATPQQIEEQARKLRSLLDSGIQTLMTWKPSCNWDSARFSYEGMVSCPEIFYRAFDIRPDARYKETERLG
ncbi:hypothetical protein BU26DRAFT_579933 [Trematosphaeria pertusa]|uniref:Uncharacterized protein n=1 Tax=Trematosphaeria pertusa TaxID=390896 RepID=A0A6A6I0N9_9PLEO|nr:uncharacterized protein BU26DRAFT_579933 [Trematosphaeria pertusa]KAF2244064.1 hypothetical protein BU26DRAFT_579933 [Trematosphaeria pertusa]